MFDTAISRCRMPLAWRKFVEMNAQKTKSLGSSSLKFAPLAFGGNVLGWTADKSTSFRLLDTFVDHGFSFIDTADVYSRWATQRRYHRNQSRMQRPSVTAPIASATSIEQLKEIMKAASLTLTQQDLAELEI